MARDTQTLMTAEEFADLPDDGLRRRELVHGEVIEMGPAAFESNRISMRLGMRIAWHVERQDAGAACAAEAGYILARDPDVVRAPDVSVVLKARYEALHPSTGFFPGAPDFAVEVVSPTDRPLEVRAKVRDYLEAGTRLVWVVWPETRRIDVHRPDAETSTLGENDTLDGDPVLPDLRIPVKDVFAGGVRRPPSQAR